MIRFRIGSSVFQFRKSAAVLGAICLIFGLGLFYISIGSVHFHIPRKPKSYRAEVDKSELTVLELRLQRLEEELRRNRIMLGQVKDTVKELLRVGPDSDLKKRFLESPVPLRLNRSYISFSSADCNFCMEPPVHSDFQTLDVYDNLKFDNPDGGVWKQGWDLQYKNNRWSPQQKLRIFVVPHSHNDPGWLKTFEKYYKDQTQHILNNMVVKLKDDVRRKFIWAEISFFSMWWDKADNNAKQLIKRYLADGQLEIVTGGWVMTDEAATHYYAMIEQMVEGHQWLELNLEYRPKNGWAIDPFGLSPTMAYLLKRMGLDNMVIQRVHYSVKKYLAQQSSLEFLWRQPWDHNHTVDILCHLMPFYSYDVPHTCGPNPKVCCQFDFKRLPGNKVNCPWRIPPVPITDKNVADRAWLLLDQYRKKSLLYRTNVVLIPLGDDFRYDKVIEWDQQFNNYQKLFDYMNSREDWYVEAQFGTLEDYFTAVREESGVDSRNMPVGFPSLVGDFFTYADRDDHYWSGYYTSRPFYKHMDRTLEAHLRGAEILFSLLWSKMSIHGTDYLPFVEGLMKNLVDCRRALGLFQHHDAITGTSKDPVVVDYANRMFQSILKLQKIISHSIAYLLSSDSDFPAVDLHVTAFRMDEHRQQYSSIPTKLTLKFSSDVKVRTVVLFNSLGHSRKEIVFTRVSFPSVEVRDSSGSLVPSQISPVFSKTTMLQNEFELAFLADIPALGLVTYTIHLVQDIDINGSRAKVTFYNLNTLPESRDFLLKQVQAPQEFTIQSSYVTASFSGADGMLRRIVSKEDGTTLDIRIQFLMYGTRPKGKDRSGAYLFLPDSAAQDIKYSKPHIRIVEGPLMSEVVVFLPEVEHHVKLKNSPGMDGAGIDIYNVVDMSQEANKEVIMRLYTNISNFNQEYYTDLNGFQVIKRRTFDKLPLQANVYPMATMAYLQDNITRLTVLTGQPLGVASLKPGWLEIFLDRRLNQDDNRGLQQGVTDNKNTPSVFRLILEHLSSWFSFAQRNSGSLSYPSLLCHHALSSLLHPPFTLIKLEPQLEPLLTPPGKEFQMNPTFTSLGTELPCDIHLVNLRTLQSSGSNTFLPSNHTALFLHRFGFDCGFRSWGLNCQTKNGTVSVMELFPELYGPTVEESSLSLMYSGARFGKEVTIQIPPMEMVALKLTRR